MLKTKKKKKKISGVIDDLDIFKVIENHVYPINT